MSAIITEEDVDIQNILQDARTIAVVGASTNPHRDSSMIMQYLIKHGYDVVPVNPKYDKVLDLRCYPNVSSIERQVDIVDVFRRNEYIEETARDAVEAKAGTLWMQLGIENLEAARYAAENGMKVVMNRCIMVEHRRLIK